MNPNLLNQAERVRIITDIKNQEDNKSRKREHQKRFDVYRERQDVYILERLQREFNQKTVNQMRKVLSVNLSTRIIDEMSSVYNSAPERTFAKVGDKDVSDKEQTQLEALYEECRVNQAMRRANKFYNLHDQCALMCVPDKNGNINVRAIPPIHYDVIPHHDDQEKAFAYILNVWDFDLYKTARDEQSEPTQMNRYRQNDRINQKIADDNDRLAMQERYVVWTDELHFTMDGNGDLLGEVIENPIGRLPFIDIASDKDFQFFVRRGTSVVDFALDFGLMLSDLSNIIRLQGYSQAIVYSEKQPTDMVVGPNHILWMPLDPARPELQPRFEFSSPSPDLNGALEFMETTLRMFLSSRGIDPATISGKGEARSFSSGVERLLAMLDKFEASRSDFDLFKNVEMELFELMVSWSNVLQDVTGDGELKPKLKNGKVSEDAFLDISFAEPSAVQTKTEKEESVMKLLDAGLMSRKEAIMEIRDVSEEAADQILEEIDEVEDVEPEAPAVPDQNIDEVTGDGKA